MKPLFTILFILISLVSYSQEGQLLGNALKHEFVTSDWGKKWGLFYTPNDTLKHPVIAFFHGVGEAGTGSSDAALSKLQTHGVFNFIKSGNKMEFINPVNGKLTKFICIALCMATEWSNKNLINIVNIFFIINVNAAFILFFHHFLLL